TNSDRPALEGQTEIQSTQIVDGRLNDAVPVPPEPPAVEQIAQAEAEAAPKLEQIPLSGFEKSEGDEESFGSNVAKFPEGTSNVQEYVEGLKDVPLIDGANTSQPRIDPMRPRP